LDTAPVRTDFGRRRDVLKAWSLSVEDWQDLIDGLPEQPMGGYVRSHTHWGEGKRLLASTWIWTNVTQGDHIYAPAVRPVLDGHRPGGKLGRYVHQRWRFMDSGHNGQYGALRGVAGRGNGRGGTRTFASLLHYGVATGAGSGPTVC
jgi:hypothetical protein